jgi:hypothetical protein
MFDLLLTGGGDDDDNDNDDNDNPDDKHVECTLFCNLQSRV